MAKTELPIDILSRTVSELSQLIVQILDTLHFWAPLWGLRDNARCLSWRTDGRTEFSSL